MVVSMLLDGGNSRPGNMETLHERRSECEIESVHQLVPTCACHRGRCLRRPVPAIAEAGSPQERHIIHHRQHVESNGGVVAQPREKRNPEMVKQVTMRAYHRSEWMVCW